VRPAVEPRTKAARIDARAGAEVLPKVEEHVGQGVPYLGGRMEGVAAVTLDPDRATAPPVARSQANGWCWLAASPARRPPQVPRAGKSNCLGRRRSILIGQ
jgi:hypothetical protein